MVKQFLFFFVSLDFFAILCLYPVHFRIIFFLVRQFFGSFSLRFDFFASFCLFRSSFSLQIFAVSLRCETSEIMPFFRFQAKRNFRFNFNFRFRSENEGAPYYSRRYRNWDWKDTNWLLGMCLQGNDVLVKYVQCTILKLWIRICLVLKGLSH